MIKLTITEKGGEPRALAFDQDEVSIGRVQGNDIVLPKGNISKRHSKLTLVDGKIVVADAKSTNGTYVNGRKIGEATGVRPGDKIFVGDFLIVIDPSGAAETSSTGSRRGPPPPPPPPPRPGSALRHAAPSVEAGSSPSADLGAVGGGHDSGVGTGAVVDLPLSGSRGRPPAPPPPPPRRTISTTALREDGVDIGMDDAPPSPDEVDAGLGEDNRGADVDGPERLSSDLNDLGLGGGEDDGGNDVFGSRAAPDEDAAIASNFSGALAEVGGLNDAVTPIPSAASARIAAAPWGSGAADTHGPASVSLETLLADPTVTSVLIAPGGAMQVDRAGKIEAVPAVGDGNAIAETVWQIANTAVPPPPSDNPIVDVRLLDGTRITALFPPITSGSVCAAIRKAATPELRLAEIAGSGDVESILRAAIASRCNLLLAGERPAVATLLSSLGEALPADRRVVSIGAGAKGRPGWIELGSGLDPAGLARAAIAFGADHLLFADAGGGELPELLLGAARGQDGLIACMAARSAAEALARLRAFSVAVLGASAFAPLVASTIDLVLVVGASANGEVRLREIAEPQVESESVVPSFVARQPNGNRDARTLDVVGVSVRLAAAIAVRADALPAHLVRT